MSNRPNRTSDRGRLTGKAWDSYQASIRGAWHSTHPINMSLAYNKLTLVYGVFPRLAQRLVRGAFRRALRDLGTSNYH